ncbi:NUDIX domain-containing protein [uncultured Pseudokineococcus sp.]|uniref:NUDIX hydrolase n=1 Tax=uncultured Pseudokineococcus sp. TaxID=1642928 RepID=UPI002618227D|nr:NUDIX domain-containing protein [uncultured Pseudokineococcus sp.]
MPPPAPRTSPPPATRSAAPQPQPLRSSTEDTASAEPDGPLAGRTDPVRAAGALVWRLRSGRLQVALVHRPAYDDWSFPKGKLDPGESAVGAAVREVAEETGLRVVLGQPLPAARYVLGGSGDRVVKHVAYWAAPAPAGGLPRPPRPREVDRTEWVDVDEAHRRLTRRGDQVQLRALAALHEDGCLDTWALVVVRHGHARPTTVWAHDEADRPLVASGRREAKQLVPLLAARGPARVVSSPWERCLQTVRPFVEDSGVGLRTKGRLTESAHRRDPDKVARYVGHLVDKGRPVVVCTHRPVLGTLLGALAGRAAAGSGAGAAIPATDPFLAPGEALVAHVSRRSGRVVAVERHAPQP